MKEYFHSVTLDKERCKGCTNCIKLCPTQAIRVQKGKAKIIKERCIDCGECIRVCPYHAKQAVTDPFSVMEQFTYKVALPAPSFYGQFSKAKDINMILTGLKKMGFDHVFEVAKGAEVVTRTTRQLFDENQLEKPFISSACPAVLKLITINFPNLIPRVAPVKSPMEISGAMARKEAVERTGLKPEEIGIFFISPAAKMTVVKSPIELEKSNIDAVFSMKEVYLELAHTLGKIDEVEPLGEAGCIGVGWANSGGEAAGFSSDRYIAVDGINNVIKVLEDLEDEKIHDVDFVEALACTGGCVGGPLVVENNFVAQSRIKRLQKDLPVREHEIHPCISPLWEKPMVYRSRNSGIDMAEAIMKMQQAQEIYEGLPQLDCGSCGSPSCKALAEDIVNGFARETDCIFKLREKLREVEDEMNRREQKTVSRTEEE